MIAIDLDGTLLNERGRISEANLAAISRAREAGVLIVPCTGRAWRESRAVLEPLRTTPRPETSTDATLPGTSGVTQNPGVFVTGAVIADLDSGQPCDMAVIEPNLVHELVRFLENLPEAVLVCRESALCGHDYLVTGNGSLTPNTQWWFESTGATVHFQKSVTPDDLHHTLRVGIVGNGDRVAHVLAQIRQAFQGRVLAHSFEAVQVPDPGQGMHVLEAFAAGVDKWRGIRLIADHLGIESSQIAAVGDQINDVAMLHAAGCGIAMGNAIDAAKDAADHLTRDCNDDGVAHAINKLLDGQWGA